jgi:hypothetical protein
MSKEPNAKRVTIYGRLSFPTFTAQQAYERSLKGQYPAKDVGSANPDFQLVLTDAQWEKFLKHAVEVFLPYCEEQHKQGQKRDALEPKEVKLLKAQIEGDLDSQTLNTPAKPVKDEMLALVPDAVAVVKAIGPKGGNIQQKAIVNSEAELEVPDPDLLSFPVVKGIGETKHELYPGCYATATLDLYSYRNGKNPGFSAGVSTVVFKADADRFGGGGPDVDLDEIFAD